VSEILFDGVEHALKRRDEQRRAEKETFAGPVLESLDHAAVQERLAIGRPLIAFITGAGADRAALSGSSRQTPQEAICFRWRESMIDAAVNVGVFAALVLSLSDSVRGLKSEFRGRQVVYYRPAAMQVNSRSRLSSENSRHSTSAGGGAGGILTTLFIFRSLMLRWGLADSSGGH
jgi:hypothetical protein